MKEAQFQTKFTRWARHHFKKSTATELKVARGGRFYIKQVKPHQVRNLYNTKHKGIYKKIPDVGYDQKLFDGFFLKGDALVVVMYEDTKNVYAIDIDEFLLFDTPSVKEEDLNDGWLIEGF
jgi:hypothetical protein